MNFVGIDLHKKTISLCVVDQERNVLDRRRFSRADVAEPLDVRAEQDSADSEQLQRRSGGSVQRDRPSLLGEGFGGRGLVVKCRGLWIVRYFVLQSIIRNRQSSIGRLVAWPTLAWPCHALIVRAGGWPTFSKVGSRFASMNRPTTSKTRAALGCIRPAKALE